VRGPWRELLLAAEDAVRADCRRHRERARVRLSRALDGVRHEERSDAADALLRRLLAYAQEYQEDPIAGDCVSDARSLGILPPLAEPLPKKGGSPGGGRRS
jgi:hypothetical protein